MATLNQERFILATDDKIEELQNGAKISKPSKVPYVILVKSVEDVHWYFHSCQLLISFVTYQKGVEGGHGR